MEAFPLQEHGSGGRRRAPPPQGIDISRTGTFPGPDGVSNNPTKLNLEHGVCRTQQGRSPRHEHTDHKRSGRPSSFNTTTTQHVLFTQHLLILTCTRSLPRQIGTKKNSWAKLCRVTVLRAVGNHILLSSFHVYPPSSLLFSFLFQLLLLAARLAETAAQLRADPPS